MHPRRRPWTAAVALTVAALLAAGCGSQAAAPEVAPDLADSPRPAAPTEASTPDASSGPDGTTAPTPDKVAGERGLVVTTADSDFGTMLFDRTGQAIYLFDKESGNRARCYGACAAAWPPVVTRGEPRAAGLVRPGLLGTTERVDGSTQVTYANHPLYYYLRDSKNEVLCHNVTEYGGLWLVVTPNGTPAA
ncbi:MAG: hypothetical protein M3Q17_00035 [Actinomycetota bacterium]|nr:hypothetical protein [Actinomycetota bacterium]